MIGAGHSVCPSGMWNDRRYASNRAHRRRPCRLPSLRSGAAAGRGLRRGRRGGQRGGGREGRRRPAARDRPLDIQLPDLDGLAVAEQLAVAPDAPAVVLISSRDAAAYGPRLQATPARGFIPKRGLSGEALAALIG